MVSTGKHGMNWGLTIRYWAMNCATAQAGVRSIESSDDPIGFALPNVPYLLCTH